MFTGIEAAPPTPAAASSGAAALSLENLDVAADADRESGRGATPIHVDQRGCLRAAGRAPDDVGLVELQARSASCCSGRADAAPTHHHRRVSLILPVAVGAVS
jgi:hypothetical protein